MDLEQLIAQEKVYVINLNKFQILTLNKPDCAYKW